MAGRDLLDDVVVLELLEKADLANCGGGDALVLCLEPDFLEGDDLAGAEVACLVDDAVCTWARGKG